MDIIKPTVIRWVFVLKIGDNVLSFNTFNCFRCGKEVNLMEDSHSNIVLVERNKDELRYPCEFRVCLECSKEFEKWIGHIKEDVSE